MATEKRTLLLATRNPGKVRELARLLAGTPYALASLAEAGIATEVQETGRTFEENARLKASGYSAASGLLTLADDSGLEVDALDGQPGVLSARYGGPGLSDGDRVRALLERMKTVPGWKRQARFRAVLALAGPGVAGDVTVTHGVIEGAIAHEPIGANGFGYDPVFWLKDRAKTLAELSGDEKDAISHRGQAARKMADALRLALAGQPD
jgi:XTP/dITP diphosphohydrolase